MCYVQKINRITPLGFNFLAAEHWVTDKTKCMIQEIKTKVNYNEGLLSNKNLATLARIINILIEKSNEQTKIINQLIKDKHDNSTEA